MVRPELAILVTRKRSAPGGRQSLYWLMSWVAGGWKVQLPGTSVPLWRKGAAPFARPAGGAVPLVPAALRA